MYCLLYEQRAFPRSAAFLWEADNVENLPGEATATQPEGRAARAAPRGGGTPAGGARAVSGGRGRGPPPRLLPAWGAHALWRRQGRAAAVAAGGALPRSRSPSPSARALPPCCCEPLAAEGGGRGGRKERRREERGAAGGRRRPRARSGSGSVAASGAASQPVSSGGAARGRPRAGGAGGPPPFFLPAPFCLRRGRGERAGGGHVAAGRCGACAAGWPPLCARGAEVGAGGGGGGGGRGGGAGAGRGLCSGRGSAGGSGLCDERGCGEGGTRGLPLLPRREGSGCNRASKPAAVTEVGAGGRRRAGLRGVALRGVALRARGGSAPCRAPARPRGAAL